MHLTDLGIDHLSHSNLDLWQRNPGGWFLRYVKGVRGGAKPAMIAGNAGEDAVLAFLSGEIEAHEAGDYAVARYDHYEKQDNVSRDDKKREQIGLVAPLVCHHLDGCELLGSQEKVEIYLPGIDIPIWGYTDFRVIRPGANSENVIDTKMTGRKPSDISYSHRRQGAVYGTAFPDASISFVYGILKSKPEVMEINLSPEAIEDGFNEVFMAARSLIKTVELAHSEDDLVTMMTPVMDDYVWDGEMIEARKEVFGV